MIAFNILKPDILGDKEALKFYFNSMKSQFGINIESMYCLKDWVKVSKLLYEIDGNSELDTDEILIKRKKILTSILGYYLFYHNQPAIVCLFDVDLSCINDLKIFTDFKKELRKRYVINTDKYYIKILNESEISFKLPLSLIDLETVLCDSIIVPFSSEFFECDYEMVFFNKIHFPDPNIEVSQKELEILRSNDIFNESNRIKRLLR